MKTLLWRLVFVGMTLLLFTDIAAVVNLTRFVVWTLGLLVLSLICVMSHEEYALKLDVTPPPPPVCDVLRYVAVLIMAAYGLFFTAGFWFVVNLASQVKLAEGRKTLEEHGVK